MRRMDIYRVKRRDNLGDPDFWNKRFEDIDLRLAKGEDALRTVDEAADRVERLALDRVNNVLSPLAGEAIERLTSVSTLFEATSTTPVTMGEGERRFTIAEGKRLTFAPLLYLVIFPTGDFSRYMAARTVSYSQVSGDLVVDVMRVVGAGDGADWQIAPMAFVSDLEALANTATDAANVTTLDRAAVAADKAIVAADKVTVAADKAIVAADKATTLGHRNVAEDRASAAAASAALAASHASNIAPFGPVGVPIPNGDADTITANGRYYGRSFDGVLNLPTNEEHEWYVIDHMAHLGGVQAGYHTQVAYKVSSNLYYIRHCIGGDWSAWVLVESKRATPAEILSKTGDNFLSTQNAWDAAAWLNVGNISGTHEFDLSLGSCFHATLAGNTIIDFKNAKSGQPFSLVLVQDAVGGRTVSWSSKFLFPDGAAPLFLTGAGAYACIYSGIYDLLGKMHGTGWKVS